MALKDYVIPTRPIDLGAGNQFFVRGATFADLTRLIADHGPILVLIYNKITDEAKSGGLTAESLGGVLQNLVVEFPRVASDIIWLASDELDPAVREITASLPLPVQMEALQAVIEQTFVSEGQLKKLVEIVTQMAVAAQGAMTNLTSPSASGAGAGAFASR